MDIDALQPGPESDALVAEKVMGYVWDESCCRVCGWKLAEYPRAGCWPDNCCMRPLPSTRADSHRPYSTDIAAAWEVVEKLAAKDFDCQVSISSKLPSGDPECWYCQFQYGDDNAPWRREFKFIQVWAPTAPIAICRAALKVVAGRADLVKAWPNGEKVVERNA